MRVLVVEDEAKLARLLARGLTEEGHLADVAGRGEDAVSMAKGARYDAVVLDVTLPDRDGFETCRELRANGVSVPVLFLTARDEVEEHVHGIETPADDYLAKPFSFAELLARLTALVRVPDERLAELDAGELRVDPPEQRALRPSLERDLGERVRAAAPRQP
jgi:two-component system, OmpR family, response regulator